jgi:cytochrome c553
VNYIIAYLRETKHERIELNEEQEIRGDAQAGHAKYTNFCSSCHGPNGEGYTANLPGTSIGLSSFLDTASDDYILQTLKKGRIGTPMRAFIGARGLANLSHEDATDIIAHLRTLASSPPATESDAVSAFE